MSTDLEPQSEPAASPVAATSANARSTLFLAALLAALAPFVASAISLLVDGGAYRASGDIALIELRVRGIGSHLELVGAYSRFGWFHPGPALFYLLALPFKLTGSTNISLPLAALVLNGACVVAIAFVARRRGGLPLTILTLLVVALLLHGCGPEFLRNPWNPYLGLLPMFLLVLVAWSATSGERWAMPVMVGLASLIVQAHAGFTLFVAAIVAVTAVWFVVATRGTDRGRVVLWSALVLVAFWVLPVFEQLTHDPGNLRLLAEFFNDRGQSHSWHDAWNVVAQPASPSFPWVSGNLVGWTFPSEPTPFPLALVGLVLVAWPAARRVPDVFRLIVVVLVAALAGFVSVTRIAGPVLNYTVLWNWVLSALAWLAVGWLAWSIWGTRSRAVTRDRGRGARVREPCQHVERGDQRYTRRSRVGADGEARQRGDATAPSLGRRG